MRGRPHRARKSRKPADPGHAWEGEVSSLGAQGDGLAEDKGAPLYVPFSLPGERVKGTARNGRLEELTVLERSPDRVAAPCPVFGACGGCALQHMEQSALAKWKREQVVTALSRRGFEDVSVHGTVTTPGASRRRVTLHYDKGRIGFAGRRSHQLVEVGECLILTPRLQALWPKLASLAKALGGKGQIYCLDTETGPDIDLRPASGALDRKAEPDVIAAAKDLGAARICVHGEIFAQWEAPQVTLGAARVTPVPGGFLQPSAEGEAALVGLVAKALEGISGPVADLFSGCGTFTFPLATERPVHAVEGEAAALEALKGGLNHTSGLKPITTERRDLDEWPLTAKEFSRYEAGVFDPPRAGAEAQARELAAAKLGKVVGVSCNPATFARDARILVDGGFRLCGVTPVDQFAFAPHIECVGIFERT